MPAATAPSAVPDVTVDGRPLIPEASRLAPLAGRSAVATAARVQAVPADEGFWLGTNDARIWVEFDGRGESRVQVKVGQELTFTAKVVANTLGFPVQVGLAVDKGRPELERDGYHLQVDPRTVHVSG